jgi:hypothetical protein
MVYVYLFLGIACMLMSGMWIGSIFTDNAMGYAITITQYFMVVFMFAVGFFQFLMLYRTLVLE